MRPLAPPVAPPKILGRYEVGAKIGGGGMATVYIGFADREDGTEEHVALKVIRDELAHDEEFARMFVDEAKILAQLSHPNVIHTLEYGVTGHHRFIAMELLHGRTFQEAWELLASKNESVPLPLAAWICARTAEGLHSAHELADEAGTPLSVIHRDVNPGNIFLTLAGEVKLIDFGLAKARVRLSKSAEGIVKGKIPYLAPEQATGKAIDRRIDLYALGTTLWEACTMKRLFKRATDIDTLRAIREAKVPDAREMLPDFPEELWSIIARSLRINADERYQTAAEMQADLDAFAGDARKRRQELIVLLERLYPGQEARQASWERAATAKRAPMQTMPPPVAVPMASTAMLHEPGSDPHISSDAMESVAAAAEPEPPPPESKKKQKTDESPVDPEKKKSKKSKKRRDKAKSKARLSGAPPARSSSRPPRRNDDDDDDRDEDRGRARRREKRSGRPAPIAPDTSTSKRWIAGVIVVALAALAYFLFSGRK